MIIREYIFLPCFHAILYFFSIHFTREQAASLFLHLSFHKFISIVSFKKIHFRRTEGPRLSELGRSLVTSYSLKAYIDLLGVNHRQSIASWLYGNTSSALGGLFRFPNALIHCEDSDSAAIHSVRNGIGTQFVIVIILLSIRRCSKSIRLSFARSQYT